MKCRHCGHVRANRPRRLCHRCFYDLSIRDLYPPSKMSPGPEPTESELLAMIAEQLPTMPPKECEDYDAVRDPALYAPRIVRIATARKPMRKEW